VYLIGPLLILLALFIISLLTYTFFTILLPMLRLKHADSSLSNVYLGLHCTWVVFLVVNILFNYALCVITQNKGSNYDKLVRELAEATDFPFPETPEELARYRRDYEDRMVLRMRCRQARHVDAAATASSETAGSTAGSTNGVTHRRTGATSPTGSALIAANDQATSSAPKSAKASTPAPHLRRWMIMTPFEWGYCMNSKQPKPPRSHYDHVTKTLVLNLDHYCPWMFNVSTLSMLSHVCHVARISSKIIRTHLYIIYLPVSQSATSTIVTLSIFSYLFLSECCTGPCCAWSPFY
jgi:palmitoyltransferase